VKPAKTINVTISYKLLSSGGEYTALPIRFVGTAKQYSIKAILQLTKMANTMVDALIAKVALLERAGLPTPRTFAKASRAEAEAFAAALIGQGANGVPIK
jgi:hypothetical protein